jgi:dienelactone hydrolase
MRSRSRGVAEGLTSCIGAASFALALSLATASLATSEPAYGPFGPQGPRLREQLWIVPGADAGVPLRATVFRPDEPAAQTHEPVRRPLVVINHGSDDATREAVSMPIFYWLSKWFVDRGYVVLLPQRRGHGATGGEFVEGRDRCSNPDHYGAGAAAADDIAGALRFMGEQPFIDPGQTIVVGVSSGGWASLALAARNPPGVRLVVNFSGGRGGHAYGRPNAICGSQRLIEAAGAFGHVARIPTLWFYANNDSYFGPELATSMANAWQDQGGRADLRLMPDYGAEGHEIAADRVGSRLWGADLEQALEAHASTQVRVSGSLR